MLSHLFVYYLFLSSPTHSSKISSEQKLVPFVWLSSVLGILAAIGQITSLDYLQMNIQTFKLQYRSNHNLSNSCDFSYFNDG